MSSSVPRHTTSRLFLMKKSGRFPVVLLFFFLLLSSCLPASESGSTPAGKGSSGGSSPLPTILSWQIQYSGKLDTDLDVQMFDLDLFDVSKETIDSLHRRGVYVVCYFSAGSYEDWRPDASRFPREVLGKEMEGWPGEKWLDVRRIDLLAPIMRSRLDLAASKRCDGVDPDNVNGYENDTGFPIGAEDQIAYNLFLSKAAHRRNLAIGLKNDLDQIPALVSHFDWELDEECFSYGECGKLLPFVKAGKPVFVIEYDLPPEKFCRESDELGFNALLKHRNLDAYRVDCHEWGK